MKGSKFLKVTGILMIIGGAIGLILGIVALVSTAGLAALVGSSGLGLLYAASSLALVGGALEMVAGIVGVKNCNKPEKAGACIGWGVVVAVMSVLSNILNVVAGGSLSVPSLLLGLVLPVLYIIGAAMNKKAAV